jgi:hypothetical protein
VSDGATCGAALTTSEPLGATGPYGWPDWMRIFREPHTRDIRCAIHPHDVGFTALPQLRLLRLRYCNDVCVSTGLYRCRREPDNRPEAGPRAGSIEFGIAGFLWPFLFSCTSLPLLFLKLVPKPLSMKFRSDKPEDIDAELRRQGESLTLRNHSPMWLSAPSPKAKNVPSALRDESSPSIQHARVNSASRARRRTQPALVERDRSSCPAGPVRAL